MTTVARQRRPRVARQRRAARSLKWPRVARQRAGAAYFPDDVGVDMCVRVVRVRACVRCVGVRAHVHTGGLRHVDCRPQNNPAGLDLEPGTHTHVHTHTHTCTHTHTHTHTHTWTHTHTNTHTNTHSPCCIRLLAASTAAGTRESPPCPGCLDLPRISSFFARVSQTSLHSVVGCGREGQENDTTAPPRLPSLLACVGR